MIMKNAYCGQKKECCGCTACKEICPKNAISMFADEKGFLYPTIDEEKCVNCGLCTNTCSFCKNEYFSFGDKPIKAIGLKHKDENIRHKSRSGGAFTIITNYVLENNGCVYGAVLDDDLKVRHIIAENIMMRDKMRGSKYVQSDMGECFRDAKNKLDNGRLVAFSGTACQIDGLRSFLKRDYDNLITIDIVCHGVPSPKVWDDYLEYISKKNKKRIADFDFRDKSILGWDMHLESYKVGKHKTVSNKYSGLFQKNLILRDSCFNCKYCNLRRPGDFTLADFWGIDRFNSEFNDNKGVSLLLVNSEKAVSLLKNGLKLEDADYFECQSYDFIQPNLKRPTAKPDGYDAFWDEYSERGIEYLIHNGFSGGGVDRIKFLKSIAVIYFKRKVLKK